MHPTHNQTSTDTAPPADVTPAVILRGAARYLQLHGWHQGTLYACPSLSPTPPACAMGAVGMAVFGERIPDDCTYRAEWCDYQRAKNSLDDYLTLTGAKTTVPTLDEDDNDGVSVGDWNDAPGRTAAEVIATLCAAADHYDRIHGGAR